MEISKKKLNASFQENKILIFQWPVRLPDLNHIENEWSVLDLKLTNDKVKSGEYL